MARGYSRRCCSKTQKGTRCKLSNAFSGAFCHIHAPRLSTGEVCTKAEWEVEQELLASQVEAPLAEDEEYNPCSKKFSPQAPVSEPDSETEDEAPVRYYMNPYGDEPDVRRYTLVAPESEPDSETEDEAPELEIDSDFETDPGVVLFKQAFSDAVFVEVPGQVPTLKLSDKGESMMQSGEFYERFAELLQK
jgi:hypothetical protein